MNISISREEGAEDGSASFLQSRFWGDFKAEYGWRPLCLRVEASPDGAPSMNKGAADAVSFQLLLLIRRLPAGFSFAYVPHGPEIEIAEDDRSAFIADLAAALRPLLPPRCLFIRFDPPWYCVEGRGDAERELEARPSNGEAAAAEVRRPILGRPLRRAAAYVQVPDTVLVDLSPSEEGILALMKPKWRYNIRLAEKKGVVVEEAGVEAIGEFYELYRTTSERDKIALHPEEYYRRLFGLASELRAAGRKDAPDIRLWVARYEGRTLAANITLFRGRKAVYLYGASSNEHRNLMPTYALQWAAMRAAKESGCLEYDLFGMPPTADPSHPMHGLYLFKTGFGGAIIHRAGSWDIALAPFAYALFRAAEAARTWYFKDFRKRLRRG